MMMMMPPLIMMIKGGFFFFSKKKKEKKKERILEYYFGESVAVLNVDCFFSFGCFLKSPRGFFLTAVHFPRF